jgi:hypothetical protein
MSLNDDIQRLSDLPLAQQRPDLERLHWQIQAKGQSYEYLAQGIGDGRYNVFGPAGYLLVANCSAALQAIGHITAPMRPLTPLMPFLVARVSILDTDLNRIWVRLSPHFADSQVLKDLNSGQPAAFAQVLIQTFDWLGDLALESRYMNLLYTKQPVSASQCLLYSRICRRALRVATYQNQRVRALKLFELEQVQTIALNWLTYYQDRAYRAVLTDSLASDSLAIGERAVYLCAEREPQLLLDGYFEGRVPFSHDLIVALYYLIINCPAVRQRARSALEHLLSLPEGEELGEEVDPFANSWFTARCPLPDSQPGLTLIEGLLQAAGLERRFSA